MENKFSKYLIYAVGEILLVVIGILIAFQVDNWNEDRKLVRQESALLSDLRSDLEETLRELQFGKSLNENSIRNCRMLLGAIDNNEPYSAQIDSAIVHINFFHVPRFRRTTYETLKSRGDILSNDSLKRTVSNIYDRTFSYLIEDHLKLEWATYNQQTLRYNEKYLRFKGGAVPVALPVDFEKIKSDTGFANYLSLLIGMRNYGVSTYANTIEEIQKVITSINEELETLKS